MAATLCRVAGLPEPRVGRVPKTVVRAAGVFSSQLRELRETSYQFDRPFVLDSSQCTSTFGIEPTPVDRAMAEIVEYARRAVHVPDPLTAPR
jgi:hypothetical protein